MKINLPNQVTLGRLALALLFFGLLALFEAREGARWLLMVCFWVFLAAALGDILDGLLARWLKQVTPFGRVVDPVVDKVLVCGAFAMFASGQFVDSDGVNITGVQAWMVIVIVIRELLVSAIRAHAEAGGSDFGANWAGKLKMFVQSATVCVILAQLGWKLEWLAPLRVACIWLTVLVTALSIVTYVRRAHAFLVASAAPAADAPGASEGRAASAGKDRTEEVGRGRDAGGGAPA